METKICKKCNIRKDINEFSKYKKNNKDYISGSCKECINKYNKQLREKNKIVLREKRKKYYRDNPQKFKEYKIKYKDARKECLKKYREKNKEKIKLYLKEYNKKNKEKRRIKEKSKRENDKIYRLKINTRLMINDAFKRKGKFKIEKTRNILNCDINFFIKYLLQTYKNNYGYEWDGIEKVHIDHIVPLSIAKTEEDVIKLCHYSNLQLLKAKDNIKKGNKLNWRLEL